jgi:hypothetical protein
MKTDDSSDFFFEDADGSDLMAEKRNYSKGNIRWIMPEEMKDSSSAIFFG